MGAATTALSRVGAPPRTKDGPVGRPEEVEQARELRAARDRRLGALLIALGILVWPAGLMVSAMAEANGYNLPVAWLLSGAFAALLTRGHRMRVKDAETVLASDSRAPIVYLRPFGVDRANRKAVDADIPWGRTAEQKMARALRHIAPFIALGDPREELPELGASRIYADDTGWQGTVDDLTRRAGTIILYMGDSESLAWEVQHVVGLGQPERIVLLRGNANDGNRFRRAFGHLFPHGLLDDVALTSRCLYFDADWRPRSLDRHSRLSTTPGSPGDQRTLVLRRLQRLR